jgi:serine/threonine protein kinase
MSEPDLAPEAAGTEAAAPACEADSELDFTPRFCAPTAIGDGGSGTVFQAEDPRLGRRVAVKVLHPDLMSEQRHTQRFLREAKATGTLEHPNIPPVYEFGQTPGGRPYLALKLIEGQTLAELVQKLAAADEAAHAEYPFHRRLQIAIALCDALEYAHERNILHRDLKPENVMLGRHGEVWLVDWGLAAPPSQEREDDDRLTAEHTFVGTLSTTAPEQLAGVYSPKSDQYSLGVVLYFLFALRNPHQGETRFERMNSLLHEVPRPAESYVLPVQGRVPREISVLLARMLAKDPEARFASVRQVKQELSIILGGDIHAICPHTFLKKSGHRLGRFLDTHNLWLAPLVILWLLYPVVHLIYLTVERFR